MLTKQGVPIITNQLVVDEITGNGINNFRDIAISCRGNCPIKEPPRLKLT